MKVRLSRAHFPVTVLGPGRRIGLWFQGCTIGCPGCLATDTWAARTDRDIDVDVLARWCAAVVDETGDGTTDAGLTGVTISGGEPFEQPAALLALLELLRPWATDHDLDLLCYSGRRLGGLRRAHQPILDLLDAVVPEPFVAAAAPGGIWRGSANQDLVALSELGERRYARYRDQPADRPRLQAVADGATFWYVGVPRPGDLDAVSVALSRRGLLQREVSWKS
jgi:anaerobic ribonucleoside-triphosphate reductase activating protein